MSAICDNTAEISLVDLHEVDALEGRAPGLPVAQLVEGERFEIRLGPHSEHNFYVGFEPRVGLFIATHRRLPLGVSTSVRIQFPDHNCVTAEGYVHWRRDTPDGTTSPGFGMRFDRLSERAASLVSRFMQRQEPLFFPEL